MHHPGPPRFVATGEEIELAPRDPDPEEQYSWQVVSQPEDSTASVGDEAVEHFVPDEPGRYVVRLTAPEGDYDLTIRVFPGGLAPRVPAGGSGYSGQSGQRSGSGGEFFSGASGSARSGSGSGAGAAGSGPGKTGRPRVSLSAAIEGDEVVVRADVAAHPAGGEDAADIDVEFELDDRDPLELSDVNVSGPRLTIPVERLSDRVRVYAVAVGQTGYSVPDTVDIDPSTPDIVTDGGTETRGDGGPDAGADSPAPSEGSLSLSQPYHPPAWAEDAVIYEVYVRTFAGQHGDETPFEAVIDRLDYIESLGIDAIWLTPVLQNDHAPHGYNITDFFSVADDLGSREDYERLVHEAHDRGMKVLFDLVCNHSARTHPFFEEAVSDPDSEYRDWYDWRTDTEPETYFDWEHIANFNFDNLEVRRHLLDAVDEWAPLVDGFRCDMAWAVPNSFWKEIHDRLKEQDSEFLLLDETIPYIPDFQAGLFDQHFDSTTYAALRRVGRGDAPAEDVLSALGERAAIGFPDHSGFMLYAENHDEARYVVECGKPAAEAALGALFTLPGSPMVYAGQEFGQRGKRDDLAWEHVDESLTDHVRALADARSSEPALGAGADLTRIDLDVHEGLADRVVGYGRDPPNDDAVVVVLNFGEDPVIVGADPITDATDLVTGETLADEAGVVVDSVAVLPADISAS